MEPCKHCGKGKEGWRATCPHCGKTQWDMFIMTFVVGFGCLGAVNIVREVDGRTYVAVIFGLVSATFLIMGLVWVKDLVSPPVIEEPGAGEVPERVQVSGARTTVTLSVPEDFFAVRFPNRCAYCGAASDGGRKTTALRGVTGAAAIQLTYPLCSQHAKAVSRNDRVLTAALMVGVLGSVIWVLLATIPNPPFGTSGLLSILVIGGLAVVAALLGGVLAESVIVPCLLFPVLTAVTGSRFEKELRGTYLLEEKSIRFGFEDPDVAREFDEMNQALQGLIGPGEGLACPQCSHSTGWRGAGTAAIKASLEAADADNLQVTCFSCGKSSTREDVVKRLERWREGEREAQKARDARKARDAQKALESETVLFAYEGRGPGGLPGMATKRASDEELKERIRQEANGAGLDVVIVPAEEWGAPQMSSLSVEALASVLLPALALVMAHMTKLGLPPIGHQELLSTGNVMPQPLTGVVFFVYRVERPVARKGGEAQSPADRSMQAATIVEELTALRGQVGDLLDAHPQSGTTAGAGAAQAQKQIPWICGQLDAAADALLTRRDHQGNPITQAQISGGLKKLVEYVRAPSYGTLMEIVYPGIDGPLQTRMDELETIIQEMER